MEIKLYCKTNETGEITSFIAGENILEPSEYDSFIIVTDSQTIENINEYRVVNTENSYGLEKINAEQAYFYVKKE